MAIEATPGDQTRHDSAHSIAVSQHGDTAHSIEKGHHADSANSIPISRSICQRGVTCI